MLEITIPALVTLVACTVQVLKDHSLIPPGRTAQVAIALGSILGSLYQLAQLVPETQPIINSLFIVWGIAFGAPGGISLLQRIKS